MIPKTPVERLRSFLEIEDDEVVHMSMDELTEELRLLGIDPKELSAEVRLHVSKILRKSDSLSRSPARRETNAESSGNAPGPLGAWFRQTCRRAAAFFQFFSKTDRAIVTGCSPMANMSQTSIGTMVFLSGVLAVISGAFAVYSAFHSSLAAVVIGLVLGAIIILLDREFVSLSRKAVVIPQLLCAVFFGLVMSAPVELKVFEPRVTQQLALSNINEQKSILDRQSQAGGVYDAKVNATRRDIEDYRAGITRSMEAMEAESIGRRAASRTGRFGQGPVYFEAVKLRDNYQRLLAQSEMELRDLEAARDHELSIVRKDASARTQSMAGDLLARREALGQIQATSFTASYMIWAIRLLFILIQVLPIALRLLMPTTDYVAIVEAERQKAIARVNAIANEQLAEIMNNPYSAPVPITFLTSGVKGQVADSIQGKEALMA